MDQEDPEQDNKHQCGVPEENPLVNEVLCVRYLARVRGQASRHRKPQIYPSVATTTGYRNGASRANAIGQPYDRDNRVVTREPQH